MEAIPGLLMLNEVHARSRCVHEHVNP